MENLVLFGGSFDPVHNGHLRIARAASLRLNADVIFVPCKAQEGKKLVASSKDRLAMLKLALKENGSSSFSISPFELNSKENVTYWIDTLSYFKERYPDRKLYFLIGADQANAFPNWKEAKRCCELAKPLYVSRPNVSLNDEVLKGFEMMRLPYELSGPVSSSAVRKLQSSDIPNSVRRYIEEHRLYYFEDLSNLISEHRLVHSVSVAHLSYEIALKNAIAEPQDLYIAGLLHDCGKNYPEEKAVAIAKERCPHFYQEMPKWSYHQFAGRYLAMTLFGVHNEAVLDAIESHATGKAPMSPYAKIVYSADKTDPLRGYNSKKLIKACYKDYHYGFVSVLEANRDYLKEKGCAVDNPLTKACMERYLGEEKCKNHKKSK